MIFTKDQVLAMLRSGGTRRYHTHAAELIKSQDVAQHSYNVCWLAYALTNGGLSRCALLHCLMHDAGERWAGDLPAPTKRTLEIRDLFGMFEDQQLLLETGLEPPPLSEFEVCVMKIADSLEGARFCGHEIAMGNKLPIRMLKNFLDYATESLAKIELAASGAFNFGLYRGLYSTFYGDYVNASK